MNTSSPWNWCRASRWHRILKQSEKAKTPIPHNLGALIVANAAAGLHHAHQLTDASGNLLGLVHRDVSPQNIMVSFEGSVKVIDFGIARALGRLGDTNSGSLKGKLGYMAPEQARGEPVDARADIFSLGVVLWECVAGRRLFLRENELATLRAVVYEPIPSASKFVEVHPALDAIIRRSVARNVDERFQTADEMRIALEQWIFSSGGASAHDLSALMKSWFPSDHLQWQRAARLALDMQESDPPIEVSFPNLAASRTGHSRTGASRLEGSGSVHKSRTESSNRTAWPLPVPTSIEKVPDLRPKFFRRLCHPDGGRDCPACRRGRRLLPDKQESSGGAHPGRQGRSTGPAHGRNPADCRANQSRRGEQGHPAPPTSGGDTQASGAGIWRSGRRNFPWEEKKPRHLR